MKDVNTHSYPISSSNLKISTLIILIHGWLIVSCHVLHYHAVSYLHSIYSVACCRGGSFFNCCKPDGCALGPFLIFKRLGRGTIGHGVNNNNAIIVCNRCILAMYVVPINRLCLLINSTGQTFIIYYMHESLPIGVSDLRECNYRTLRSKNFMNSRLYRNNRWHVVGSISIVL